MATSSDLLQLCFSHTLDSQSGELSLRDGSGSPWEEEPGTLSERSRSAVRGESARCPRDEIVVPIALLDPVKTANINTQSKVDEYWKRFARRNRTTLDGNYTAGIPADYTAGIPTELRVKLQFGQLWHSWHSNWIHSWYSNWIESEDVKQRTMRKARAHEVESESTNNTGFRFRTKRSCRDLKTDSTARSSEIRNHLLYKHVVEYR